MVEELCCGPCLAMEIRAPDAPVTFRDFVGPTDPVSSLGKGGEGRGDKGRIVHSGLCEHFRQ